VTKTWLSIDFDFFIRSLPEWDWGHAESGLFAAMGSALWAFRAQSFLQNGFDLREETSTELHANPKPHEFWTELQGLGYDFSETAFYFVADSHAAAGPLFVEIARRGDGPADLIINFDAHHDLGYHGFEHTYEMVKQGRCACDTWLCFLLCEYPELQARIVMPDWMRDDVTAQKRSVHKNLPRSMWPRVKVGAFTTPSGRVSQVVRKPGEQLDVQAVFVCRSSSWVPPWHDEEFVAFVEDGEDVVNLAVIEPFAGHDLLPPLEVREFSWKAVEQMNEQISAMMEEQRKRLREDD
jgi:hypothetical protein